MSFKDYIKDKISYVLMLLFVVVTSEILMIPFNIHIFVRIYIGIVPFIGFIICFFIEYYQKRNYYNNLKRKLDDLDEKYLISEIVNNPSFSEGKILKEILQETGKSMLENVNNYKHLTEEYKEYIELWIHEIKLPIATGKMIIENNKSEITESIDEELDKIENYIEQALFYARSNVTEKDYYIKKQSLKEIVNTAILKNKRSLLQNKVKLNLHELKGQVYTDSKWCVFIINQIIQNAVKYGKPNNKEIEIFDKSNKEYEHILKVALDRMYYSFNQDPNNWAFTPYLIEDISNSNENFIIFDYDDYTNNKDYIYDTDFNRDIFLRFSKGTRLYRLVDYLIEREHKYTINKLREKISKEEFVPANQILSGFKYMNPTSFAD